VTGLLHMVRRHLARRRAARAAERRTRLDRIIAAREAQLDGLASLAREAELTIGGSHAG